MPETLHRNALIDSSLTFPTSPVTPTSPIYPPTHLPHLPHSPTMHPTLFHLAFPVANIPDTKAFYAEGLGCRVGRENAKSVILDLYGHQLVAHVTDEPLKPQRGVYPRHFGLIFTAEEDWEGLLARSQQQQLCFYQQPKRRFTGTELEHRTFFLEDPFYNLLEFKYYAYPTAIFEEREFAQIGDR